MTKPMEGTGEAIDLKDMDGMMAAFMADTMTYYADVDAGVEMINVMAAAMDRWTRPCPAMLSAVSLERKHYHRTVTAEEHQ